MYPSVRDSQVSSAAGRGAARVRWARISRNVVMLGFTSLFTDISSEMLTAVLPLYFTLELKLSMAQFGLIDGLYQASSALVRVAAGVVADFKGRYKEVATVGYGLGVICRIGMLTVGSGWQLITGLLMLDRLGKGVRTAPRDALITLSSEKAHLGEAFGVHRAMDTVGAVLGPVLAFAVLAWAPRAYDAVFVVSLAFSIVGAAILWLFVENRRGHVKPQPRGQMRRVLHHVRFRAVAIAGALLGLLTASDALIYLVLERGGAVPATLFPLLFVGTSAVYLCLALPFGRVADRIGRHRLFLAGHVAFAALYLWLAAARGHGWISVVGCVTLLGVYYASTDGVLAALAGGLLPSADVTTGLALVSTGNAVAKLVAAALFGVCWSWLGQTMTLGAFLGGMALAIAAAAALLRADRVWTADADEAAAP